MRALLFLCLLLSACQSRPPLELPPPVVPFPPALLLCEQDVRAVGPFASHPWLAWSRDGHWWSTLELFGPGEEWVPAIGRSVQHGHAWLAVGVPRGSNHLVRAERSGRVRRSWSGPEAAAAIAWLELHWRDYLDAHRYRRLGPNSNSYVASLLAELAANGIHLKDADLGTVAWGG